MQLGTDKRPIVRDDMGKGTGHVHRIHDDSLHRKDGVEKERVGIVRHLLRLTRSSMTCTPYGNHFTEVTTCARKAGSGAAARLQSDLQVLPYCC